jgi:cell division septum initiation protein DivIVA
LRAEADSASVKIRKEADVQAQKLIDGAKGPIAKIAAQKGADALRKEAGKKATKLTTEADTQATNLVDEAKAKKQELINKI